MLNTAAANRKRKALRITHLLKKRLASRNDQQAIFQQRCFRAMAEERMPCPSRLIKPPAVRAGKERNQMTEPLLLKPADAAKTLAISARKLWGLTFEELAHDKRVPCVQIGRAVRYSPDDLRAWIESQKIGSLAS
jgi:hypothetical protein